MAAAQSLGRYAYLPALEAGGPLGGYVSATRGVYEEGEQEGEEEEGEEEEG